MKLENIRPDQMMDEVDRLHLEDVRELLKQEKWFVPVACPACESPKPTPVFEKGGFRFVECGACETLFINPRPSFDQLSEFYSRSKSIKYWNDSIFPASEVSRRAGIFAPRAAKVVELCRALGASRQLLVDVGAGFGTFCEEIGKLGHFERIVALEPSPDLAATCRKKRLEVLEQPVERMELRSIDVITNFELIEHLFNPKEFILSCRERLSPNGLLILTTPNIKGFDLAVLREKSDNVGGPNHINYFHPRSLETLLRRCGMETLEILTPGKLDAEIVRSQAQAGVLDLSRQPFLKQVLLDEWDRLGGPFQDFLATNRLSSHLWVVARKSGS